MAIVHHPAVATDIAKAVRWYRDIDPALGSAFKLELTFALERIEKDPTRFHFDRSGWRRLNLKRFPYHILFTEEQHVIRVMAVRHHQQNPSFGVSRT
jgi:toxin ParE1/3/4